MDRVDILPDDIVEANGQIIGTWQVTNYSWSLRRFGTAIFATDKVVIPESFRNIVNQAKAEQRAIRVQYQPVLGVQTAATVQLL
jgi:hypothetical protein